SATRISIRTTSSRRASNSPARRAGSPPCGFRRLRRICSRSAMRISCSKATILIRISRRRSRCDAALALNAMAVAIRPVRPGEAGLVFAFVRELAEYEHLLDAVDATEEMIDAALFGPSPQVFCDIAEWDGEAAGFALWFANFSSFRGRHGLYLE